MPNGLAEDAGHDALGRPFHELERERSADAVAHEEELVDAQVVQQRQLVVGESPPRVIDRDRRLVEVSSVTMYNGFQHDLKAVCDLAHAHGAYVYADIIQGAGAVLYAFKEALAPNEVAAPDEVDEMAMEDDPEAAAVVPPAPVKVPVVYMGEFRVVNAGPGDVTLGWTYAPSRVQRMHMDFADKATWVLYEKMPVDGHQLFSFQMVNDVPLDAKDPGVPDKNKDRNIRPLFGKMDPAEIISR